MKRKETSNQDYERAAEYAAFAEAIRAGHPVQNRMQSIRFAQEWAAGFARRAQELEAQGK